MENWHTWYGEKRSMDFFCMFACRLVALSLTFNSPEDGLLNNLKSGLFIGEIKIVQNKGEKIFLLSYKWYGEFPVIPCRNLNSDLSVAQSFLSRVMANVMFSGGGLVAARAGVGVRIR